MIVALCSQMFAPRTKMFALALAQRRSATGWKASGAARYQRALAHLGGMPKRRLKAVAKLAAVV